MPYQVRPTSLDGVLILEPQVFGDARGFFFESFNSRDFLHATGLDVQFCRTTTANRVKGCCAGCTIKFSARKVSWCASRKVKFLMWPWTCGARPSNLANGSARI